MSKNNPFTPAYWTHQVCEITPELFLSAALPYYRLVVELGVFLGIATCFICWILLIVSAEFLAHSSF